MNDQPKISETCEKYWQQKVWEIIYPGTIKLEQIQQLRFMQKNYIHWAFVVTHLKKDDDHTHVCISLGEKPKWKGSQLYTSIFNIGKIKPRKCAPLKIGKGVQGKMDFYFRYCNDQDRHPGEILSQPSIYKFKPKSAEEYKSTSTGKPLSLHASVLKSYVTEQKSISEQFEECDLKSDAGWNRQAAILLDYDKLTKMISSYSRMRIENQPLEFPMDSFSDTPTKTALIAHDFAARKPGKKKQCIVLQGPSNIGKTKLAKARFKRALVVRHMDKLKTFDPLRHDGIVFDDMSFAHYPRESVLSLMDMDDDSDINVKNSMITIPAGHPRIFCTNRELYDFADGYYDKEFSFLPKPLRSRNGEMEKTDPALMNRFTLITVNSQLYASREGKNLNPLLPLQ